MFYKNLEKMFDACYEEVVTSQNEDIQKCLKKMRKFISSEDEEEFLKGFIKFNISEFLYNDLNEEESDEIFIEYFKDAVEKLKNVKKSIVLKVELKYQEDNLYRLIEIPYCFSLADMAYAILGTFQAEAEHLFMVEYKGKTYLCHNDPEGYMGEYAENEFLPVLKLRKNSKMELCYDFGDEYRFTIQVVEIKTHKEFFELEQMQVIDGKGYGIWEDEHYALDMYYNNPQQFADFVEQQGMELEYFDIDEEFDLKESNDNFLAEYRFIKAQYE